MSSIIKRTDSKGNIQFLEQRGVSKLVFVSNSRQATSFTDLDAKVLLNWYAKNQPEYEYTVLQQSH